MVRSKDVPNIQGEYDIYKKTHFVIRIFHYSIKWSSLSLRRSQSRAHPLITTFLASLFANYTPSWRRSRISGKFVTSVEHFHRKPAKILTLSVGRYFIWARYRLNYTTSIFQHWSRKPVCASGVFPVGCMQSTRLTFQVDGHGNLSRQRGCAGWSAFLLVALQHLFPSVRLITPSSSAALHRYLLN